MQIQFRFRKLLQRFRIRNRLSKLNILWLKRECVDSLSSFWKHLVEQTKTGVFRQIDARTKRKSFNIHPLPPTHLSLFSMQTLDQQSHKSTHKNSKGSPNTHKWIRRRSVYRIIDDSNGTQLLIQWNSRSAIVFSRTKWFCFRGNWNTHTHTIHILAFQ